MKKIFKKLKEIIKSPNSKIKIMVCIVLMVLFVGLSYSYIGPVMSDVRKNYFTSSSSVDELIFEDGAVLNFTPGSDNLNTESGNYTVESTVSATVIANEGTDEATFTYSLYIEITENDYEYTVGITTPELILTVIDPNGDEITSISGLTYYENTNGLSGFDITTFGGLLRIVEDYEITGIPSTTDEWIIKISMANLDTDQSLNAVKTFTGTIDLSGDTYPYDVNITTVSNKTSEYSNLATASITTVSCDSGSYAWNYKYASLDISSTSSENYCTITKEDYDSTDSEYGENISNYIMSLVGNGDVVYEDATADILYEYSEIIMSNTDFASIENTDTYPWSYDEETKIWTSTNINVANTSGITFTIEESGSLEITSSFTGTMSSSSSYRNYLYVYQNGTLMYSDYYTYGSTELLEVSAGDEIYITYKQFSSSYSGVAAIEFYFLNEYFTVSAGYRYEGADPDNYVWFNGELWRIIGAMDTLTADGEVEMLTKLIATNSIGGWVIPNMWSTSSYFYQTLNTAYYNSINAVGETYCYNYSSTSSGCNFTTTGISASYRGMIENVVLSLGGTSSSSLTADGFFEAERGRSVSSGTRTSMTGYIGLMYMSDYGYSAGSTCTTTLGSYSSDSCAGSSWMYYGNNVWTLTNYSAATYKGWYIDYSGKATSNTNYMSYYTYEIFPVLYLKSSVQVLSGDGTVNNPYILVE